LHQVSAHAVAVAYAITSNVAIKQPHISVCAGYDWTSPGPVSLQSSRKSVSAAEGRPAGVTASASASSTAAAVVSAEPQPVVRLSRCRIPGNNLQLFTTSSQHCSHQTAAGLSS